ncbi:Dipeptide/oligopeptide/nickel ABC transporter permease/ATP-binding protein [Rhodovastum atsumiense]|uniref:Dipeptide/oligopeptide/nickel ABC transporter permease/ATP-binding protein n=1 Tax=Rhodovastum atsumiense TaxID=504468 RepID=A0A5M6IUZ9_9PROT|nr:dipeptide/oligopeptide/nickel ABC transporter permease/ATP-binding protein [Rhodovastum atsumiense]KAA5611378.1 dipeptide/oligopeptide/nickel ABC transporter permease/ATP-binding protein [Rhodovastum atsumiense]CAH2603617.1 Dipeptide/oligopeptide/nickel ABC transporter permease/ATP-binding protein [Rhodovastum atsumiense]
MRTASWYRLGLPALLLGVVLLLALAAPLLPLADPVRQDVAGRLAGPSAAHWLGQDEYGRDVLARIVWGARVSLGVAFTVALIAGAAGTALGVLGGYWRGAVELATVRLAEVVLCFPPMLLALLVVTLLGPGAGTLAVSLSVLFAPGFARVAYAETLSVRALDYVTAQQSLGARAGRILLRTLLPNILPPLIVQVSLTVAAAMVLESGLSFLGLGVTPPSPSWGLMIRSARATMEQAPALLLWPCLALGGTVLLLNLLCDRLRDLLDPRAAEIGRPGFLRRVAALPPRATQAAPAETPCLLELRELTLEIAGRAGRVPVVRNLSLTVAPGETLALVGESGSGKTLTSLAVMGLLPPAVRVAAGQILYTGHDGRTVDLLRLPEPELRRLRGHEIAMVFQDPASSLNPLLRVGTQVAEAVRGTGTQVVELLRAVGLPDPARRARAFPHELSGGQRQRVMIAAAIANHPRLLLADEPTTALDVTVQAQILDLLQALQQAERGLGLVFVTHNLAVVSEIAHRVAVMYAGELVEEGPVAKVFAAPRHPYTAALIASTPEGDAERLSAIPGTVPLAWEMPPGCRFAPRCEHARPNCTSTPPVLEHAAPDHLTRCLRWKELA